MRSPKEGQREGEGRTPGGMEGREGVMGRKGRDELRGKDRKIRREGGRKGHLSRSMLRTVMSVCLSAFSIRNN